MQPSRGYTVLWFITALLFVVVWQGLELNAVLDAWDITSLLIGATAAALLLAIQRHPFRQLSLVPFGWTILLIAACVDSHLSAGMICGSVILTAVPLARYTWRVTRKRFMNLFEALSLVACLLVANVLRQLPGERSALPLLVLVVIGTTTAWVFLCRAVVEAAIEVIIWPMYRIRARGPGAGLIPASGPVLIICNHSAYADPFWLAKVVPRPLRPLMGSVFYDLPVICWIMRYLVRAIRVPTAPFRRTAPELDEAAAALRQGECIVVFPEGRLRRQEEDLLGAFGQGAWRILTQVPQTPVVCVWIEGGWGSYTSYAGGKPMRGKTLDWRRKIDVALAEPVVLAPELLARQEATRTALRRAVLECRGHLGLAVPPEEPTDNPEGGQKDNVHEINP